MKAKVLKSFLDKENKCIQLPGKVIELSEERFEKIKTVDKKLLEEVCGESLDDNEADFPKHTGGGWYELSNGEKIQGKDEAIKAENELRG